MSVNSTRRELEKLLATGKYGIPSSVYELRYVKINVTIDKHSYEIWVYMGEERDYLLLPGVFCSCKDFILRTILNKASSYCKHQLGVYVALSRKKYIELNVYPEELYGIIQDILERGFSIHLRRKLTKP